RTGTGASRLGRAWRRRSARAGVRRAPEPAPATRLARLGYSSRPLRLQSAGHAAAPGLRGSAMSGLIGAAAPGVRLCLARRLLGAAAIAATLAACGPGASPQGGG